jgi:hypothetical protein
MAASDTQLMLLEKLLTKQDEQTAALARIEANVTNMAKSFDSHVLEDKVLERRLNKLEASNSRVKGGVAVVSFIVTVITNIAGWYFTGGHKP